MRATIFGAMLPVTEMQPTPPVALNASAVPSSPSSWTKSGPHARRCRPGRVKSPVAVLDADNVLYLRQAPHRFN